MSLAPNSRVVIVGGTSGIGLAVATAAAATGADVVIGSRSAQSVERALAQLPGNTKGHTVDVTSPESLTSFFARAGEFDHLVYTAGDDLVRMPISDYTPDQAQRFFDIRLFRALDSVRAALPTLRTTGSITLTSGAAAFRGGAGMLLGATVSGAMISAGRSLAAELSPVRVNVVAPGVVRTALWAGMPEQEQEALFATAGTHTLLGRIAELDDVAKTYLHLMDQNSTTGTVVLVDSGSVLK
ncbi:SDR family oxidoreductase [Winogradskya consettensis]|uniref:Short-chain dehydrogenase n=1 Tax=Winogradskya consettensis TaxID=113560 RepID=A0A919SZK1_9ACTN|nr:SDR family oxidoreductase [Actinoplanes consettensis]GIM80599.1 short-chain dehydrogenase [Actinoplanes consettensis]